MVMAPFGLDMEREIPTCDGCGAKGYYAFCKDCRTPDHEVEPTNKNTRSEGHNRYNYTETKILLG